MAQQYSSRFRLLSSRFVFRFGSKFEVQSSTFGVAAANHEPRTDVEP